MALPSRRQPQPHAHLCSHSYHRLNALLPLLVQNLLFEAQDKRLSSQVTSWTPTGGCRLCSGLLCRQFPQGCLLAPEPLGAGSGSTSSLPPTALLSLLPHFLYFSWWARVTFIMEDPHPFHKPSSWFYKGSNSSSPALLPTAPWTAHSPPLRGPQSLAAPSCQRKNRVDQATQLQDPLQGTRFKPKGRSSNSRTRGI